PRRLTRAADDSQIRGLTFPRFTKFSIGRGNSPINRRRPPFGMIPEAETGHAGSWRRVHQYPDVAGPAARARLPRLLPGHRAARPPVRPREPEADQRHAR